MHSCSRCISENIHLLRCHRVEASNAEKTAQKKVRRYRVYVTPSFIERERKRCSSSRKSARLGHLQQQQQHQTLRLYTAVCAQYMTRSSSSQSNCMAYTYLSHEEEERLYKKSQHIGPWPVFSYYNTQIYVYRSVTSEACLSLSLSMVYILQRGCTETQGKSKQRCSH